MKRGSRISAVAIRKVPVEGCTVGVDVASRDVGRRDCRYEGSAGDDASTQSGVRTAVRYRIVATMAARGRHLLIAGAVVKKVPSSGSLRECGEAAFDIACSERPRTS
ncbi:MAG: hypothetical protein ACM3ON_04695 [Chloroflexota bacterium]